MSDYPTLTLLIDGQWVTPTRRPSTPVLDPSTGKVLGLRPNADTRDVDAALTAAQRGFTAWVDSTPIERSTVLRDAAGLIRDRRDQLVGLIRTELGKPTREAVRETNTAAELFEWAAEECRRSYGRVIPGRQRGMHLHTVLEPVGPVAAFSGWNAPAITPARKISSAVAAGCSVVLKPSEATPATALFLARALTDAGLPPGVLNIVYGDPAEIAGVLLQSSTIRMVTFTGSVPVGKTLAAHAAQSMKRAVFELGGNAPVLVFSDIDLEPVIRGAVAAKYRNSGQVCTAPSRFLVHHAVYNQFVDRFAALAGALRVGDPSHEDTQMGPVQNPERIRFLTGLVDDAVQHGATLKTGGAVLDRPGYYFQPTVLTDVPDDVRLATEEPFGPIAQIAQFDDLDDALHRANRLSVGLAAYLFTHDGPTIDRCCRRLEAGSIAVNNWTASLPETPFGGVKDSGIGVEGGIEGLRAFQQVKHIGRATSD